MLCRSDVVLSLSEAELVADDDAVLAAEKTCSAGVDGDDDVA